jgi:hypothetical protein
VAPDVWIVDGPEVRFYRMAFPTRMVVVRLTNGDLWLHSPVGHTQWLARDLEVQGPIRHLVAPNWIHYAGIPGWQAAYPGALTWAAPGVRERAAKMGVKIRWDRDLGETAPGDWAGQIEQIVVPGSRMHREVVFFHRASRTLILTDLIENFEPGRVGFWQRPLLRLAGVLDPDGRAPVDMRMSFRRGRNSLSAAVERMIGWAPERVILAHGRWYDRDGVGELRRAFRWAMA